MNNEVENARNIKRGQVYYISSIYDTIGSEQRSGRPAVIVSNNSNNRYSRCVEIAYLTLKDKAPLPTHVHVSEGKCFNSTVLCEQITTVSIERLGDCLGMLEPETMKEIDKAIAVSLDIPILDSDISYRVSQSELNDKSHISELKQENEELRCINDKLRAVNEELNLSLTGYKVYERMYKELIASLTLRN